MEVRELCDDVKDVSLSSPLFSEGGGGSVDVNGGEGAV